ncbi:hypothetical protein GGS24DRAFT_493191 [Hypoxylon argillaceum]|nr:hypothetical protein GGS24DRAFT_493191 [Hypoxylon argillaceum]
MLRQLWAAYRNPARSLSASFLRSPRPQPTSPWQRYLFSRSGISRQGPRISHHGQNTKGPRPLQARVYATIFVSIGFLVLDEELDWQMRCMIARDVVQHITLAPDTDCRQARFWKMGKMLLAEYSGSEVEHHEDVCHIPADAVWASDLGTRVLTAPDPEVEGGTLVLCLASLRGLDNEFYLPATNNRLYDVASTLIPQIEAFARGLDASPRVRGAMLLEEKGAWISLYWDGTRWINVIYLEWQTAESIGLTE